MRARLERWLVARWYSRPGLLWLLWPLEMVVRAVVAWRAGRPAPAPSALPVIVVGNLTVGGSGKTPLVVALAEALRQRGLRVGILARGHGGRGPFPMTVDGNTDPALCGDEPLLLARRTGMPVVVGPRRDRALAHLLATPLDVVVSDDGLQHRALPRAAEVVVVDGRRGLGNGHCLPVGPLREPATRLARVDAVVINGESSLDCPGAFAMRLRPTRFRRVGADEALPVADFAARFGPDVVAVAGIGDPSRFFATLAQLGLRPEGHPFADHHPYTGADLAPFAGRVLVMTEKDAVKCARLPGVDAWYLEIEAPLPPALIARLLDKTNLSQRSRA